MDIIFEPVRVSIIPHFLAHISVHHKKTTIYSKECFIKYRNFQCTHMIFDSRLLQSNICDFLWLLECGVSVGQLNNGHNGK